jgi:replication-associated recombination protein RarA
MKFKDAINTNAKTKLVKWINEYIDGKHNKFLVLYGQSGNGKTFLIKLLAKEAGMEVYTIEPENITSIEDLNNVIKGINSAFDERLILIDDFDLFKKKYMKKLEEIPEISNYPVVFTSSAWVYNSTFLKDAVVIKLKKPLTSELRQFLIKLGADYDSADKIASESKSIRSAILSLQNNAINDLTRNLLTRSDKLQKLNSRKFEEKINRQSIKWLFESIRGYDDSSLKLMLELAEYDYKIMANFQEIDEFIVNNMSSPVEKVQLKQRFKSKNAKKPVIKMKSPKLIKKKENNFTSIDKFL